ncbi:MAG: XisI protein [Blastocatellia bacterium]
METVTGKTNRYSKVIRESLTELAAVPHLEEGIEDRLLFDEANHSYAIISEGWNGEERIHNIVIHLEIINGKIWIQADNTDVVIARELESQGIPKSDIVLGFRSPSVRPLTQYAVA